MSDIFRKALMEDAARINVPQMTWKQVKQGNRRAHGKADWKRRVFVYAAGAAVLLIMAIGVSGFVSPVMAKVLQKIPIIGTFYWSDDPRLNQYASETNLSATDKGITVFVPKVYYDSKRLKIFYNIQVPKGYKPNPDKPQLLILLDKDNKVKLNGKLLDNLGPLDNSSFKIGSAGSYDSLVSENMYCGYLNYQLISDQIPQNGTLTIPIHQVGTIKGNWTLSVPVSSIVINNNTETVFPQNTSTTYDGITLTVNKLSKGPVYTDISMQLRQVLQANDNAKSTMSLDNHFGVPMDFRVFDANHQFIDVARINKHNFKEVENEKIWYFTIECKTPSSDLKSIVIEPTLYKKGQNIPQLAVTVPFN